MRRWSVSHVNQFFAGLPREWKRALMVAADVIGLPLSLWLAFALRLGTPAPSVVGFWPLFIIVPLATVPMFVGLGLYRAVVRYLGGHAVFAVLKGVSLSALALAAMAIIWDMRGLPRTVIILYWLIALFVVGGTRFFARAWLQVLCRRSEVEERVIIYGAGSAGVQAATALQNGYGYDPIAFVDDDPALQGVIMQGMRVYPPAQLEAVARQHGALQVLLAIPSAARSRRREVIQRLERIPLHVRTLPDLADLVSGHARVNEFREVDVEDLLGRTPVAPDRGLLASAIQGKSVLVTGAAGSIGSELCRQILRLEPARLLLLELSEYGLYRIERELRATAQRDGLHVEVNGLLGSVTHRRRLQRVMEAFAVNTVYHAAAYKHVPIVEHNVIEGVRNNVFGTLHCAQAALAAGVDSFVLISSDKAVRPTNVMGATKRLAEMILQGLAAERPHTRFAVVRFGNVLGSSGSVVPLFRDQIRNGGPVTVTHPEVTRYFMTIPEASELVLQAGAMGEGGDVFVLDMGEPVKILDLARRMIHLSGLRVRDEDAPDGDIAIEFTGLRPGEKLFEELLIGDNVVPTRHPMIQRAKERYLAWPEMERQLQAVDTACRAFDCRALRSLLGGLVQDFDNGNQLLDLVWAREGQKTTPVTTGPLH
ncbi:polysaccharide biosynthesis protein [Arhodomonas sp. AD133]|uniref:polysaccharide biosynthesis protein n=1 Tax=Arhodomonas sp. AD133 TaxID=3415009 RepID=UPI003EBC84E5